MIRIYCLVAGLLFPLVVGCAGHTIRQKRLEVSMADFLHDPDRYAGREMELIGMYGGRDGAGENGFGLLSRKAAVWEEGGGEDTLFVWRDVSPFPAYLLHEVLRVRGRVRPGGGGAFRIEASEVRRWGDPLFHPRSLALMKSGLTEKRGPVAEKKLVEALRGTLSHAARYRVHMRLGELFEAEGSFGLSGKHFDWADNFTHDPEEIEAACAGHRRVSRLEEKSRLIEALEED